MTEQLDLPTREKILQMLKTAGPLSTKDITEPLGITGMAVRRHITRLEQDKLIESTMVRQPMGRPVAVYRLTKEADDLVFPKKYHTVALDLLAELEDESGESMVNHLFDRRQKTLLQKYEGKVVGMDLEGKVAALTQIQNDNGYMATWEKSADESFVITENNCPLFHIADKYNHACSCELKLFEGLLDADVERTECLAKGGSRCIYKINKARIG